MLKKFSDRKKRIQIYAPLLIVKRYNYCALIGFDSNIDHELSFNKTSLIDRIYQIKNRITLLVNILAKPYYNGNVIKVTVLI